MLGRKGGNFLVRQFSYFANGIPPFSRLGHIEDQGTGFLVLRTEDKVITNECRHLALKPDAFEPCACEAVRRNLATRCTTENEFAKTVADKWLNSLEGVAIISKFQARQVTLRNKSRLHALHTRQTERSPRLRPGECREASHLDPRKVPRADIQLVKFRKRVAIKRPTIGYVQLKKIRPARETIRQDGQVRAVEGYVEPSRAVGVIELLLRDGRQFLRRDKCPHGRSIPQKAPPIELLDCPGLALHVGNRFRQVKDRTCGKIVAAHDISVAGLTTTDGQCAI